MRRSRSMTMPARSSGTTPWRCSSARSPCCATSRTSPPIRCRPPSNRCSWRRWRSNPASHSGRCEPGSPGAGSRRPCSSRWKSSARNLPWPASKRWRRTCVPNSPTDAAPTAASAPSLTGLTAVIFDLDDTLVDARAAFEIAIDQSFRALYETITDEQSALALHLWRTDVVGHYRAYTRGELAYNEQREARLRHIAAELGLPAPTDAQVHTWVATWDAGFRAGW